MKVKKNIFKTILFFYLLVGCGTMEEAGKVLRNEKIKSTDEFLVEKKEPLTTPPDIFELPEPGQKKSGKTQNKIQEILNSNESKKENTRSSSSAEETILKNIKK